MSRVLLLAALVTIGCGGEAPVPAVQLDDGSWLSSVVLHPEQFTELVDDNHAGWVALHQSDIAGARVAFGTSGTGAVRSRLAQQVVYSDLAAITDLAVWRTLQQWQARGLAADDGILGLAPVWRRCGGPERLPAHVTADAVVPLDGTTVPEWAQDRVTAYAGSPDALRDLASEPIFTTDERVVRDPCAYAFLVGADDPAVLISTLGQSDELAARFLTALATQADLDQATAHQGDPGALGANSPSLPPFDPSNLTSVHDGVQALDAVIDAQQAALLAVASEDGSALLTELGLSQRLRQEVLTARAHAVVDTQPDVALALADIAWDATDRSVGSRNLPATASVRARALLASGRTREALDALEPLLIAVPEARGAREWVADLAVLESMGSAGNSKEN